MEANRKCKDIYINVYANGDICAPLGGINMTTLSILQYDYIMGLAIHQAASSV